MGFQCLQGREKEIRAWPVDMERLRNMVAEKSSAHQELGRYIVEGMDRTLEVTSFSLGDIHSHLKSGTNNFKDVEAAAKSVMDTACLIAASDFMTEEGPLREEILEEAGTMAGRILVAHLSLVDHLVRMFKIGQD